MTANEVLVALTRSGAPFCRRRWISVPRVSWGWGLDYEADLIAISKSGNCTEIEIKISKHDLRQDRLKKKWTYLGLDRRVSKFYYAVPEKLTEYALGEIPDKCGLISVKPGNSATSSLPMASIIRVAKKNENSIQPTKEQIEKLLHLGLMRYWDLFLKEKL